MIQDQQKDIKFLARAIQLSEIAVKLQKGGPFGCVIVKNQQIVGEGYNSVFSDSDPTAHGQIVAIRNTCKNMGSFQLDDCVLYTSCQPCMMCIGAIYWANISRVVFANSVQDASRLKFPQKNTDQIMYEDIGKSYGDRKVKFCHIPLSSATKAFQTWKIQQDSL